jgi:hypothetical protein
MTTIKQNKPLVDNSTILNVTKNTDEITVEAFLEEKCDEIIKELYRHGEQLIDRSREEFDESAANIKDLMVKNNPGNFKKLCVILKCMGGQHIGQKFRLEPNTENGEDVFKIGRSSGKQFKEKGVSLYKDKEISTTHAKIELKNGQVFLIDARSTNGTQLNGVDVEPLTPIRLKEGDVILMGSSELIVNITDFEDLENVDSVSL